MPFSSRLSNLRTGVTPAIFNVSANIPDVREKSDKNLSSSFSTTPKRFLIKSKRILNVNSSI